MIPRANILAWSSRAPWPSPSQIEQDLVISRALCEIFNDPFLAERLAFRGGTAINKLLFPSPLRYSEDIDLVQVRAEPIGPAIDQLRKVLAWLGDFRVDRKKHSTHLIFSFVPEDAAGGAALKLKVEANTREHQALFRHRKYNFAVENTWFSGKAEIVSFEADELFGTKLRAMLQRRKNRDLFDIGEGLKFLGLDPARVTASFGHYLTLTQESISRAEAEQRMLDKMRDSLTEDIAPLLPIGVNYTEGDALRAFKIAWDSLISRIAGEPWKNTTMAIEEIRKAIPTFLS